MAEEAGTNDNLDVVRKSFDAYNRGDVDGLLDIYAPDVEFLPDASFPESTLMRRSDAVRPWLQGIATAWVEGTARFSTLELFEADDGRVVHRGEWGGVGLASGVDLTQSLSSVHSIRDGRISQIEWFFDHAEALKAVGLNE